MAVLGRCTAIPLLLGRGLWREADSAIEDGLIHTGIGNEPWLRSLIVRVLAAVTYRRRATLA